MMRQEDREGCCGYKGEALNVERDQKGRIAHMMRT